MVNRPTGDQGLLYIRSCSTRVENDYLLSQRPLPVTEIVASVRLTQRNKRIRI